MVHARTLAGAFGTPCALLVLAGTPANAPAVRLSNRASGTPSCGQAHGEAHRASYRGNGCTGHDGSPGHGHRSHALIFLARHGRCPDATLAPSARNVATIRAATLCLVNRERARHGERLLHWSDQLMRAAQSHTESMAFHHYFAHVGPGGQTPLSRMRATGYVSSRGGGRFEVGENIGWGSLWLGTPRAIVAGWMASAGHRANILDPRFRETGIGVSPRTGGFAHGQPGGLYTQDFGVIVG